MNRIYVFLSPHFKGAPSPEEWAQWWAERNGPVPPCSLHYTLNPFNTTEMTQFIFSEETGAVSCYAVSSHFISPWSQIF